MKTVRPHYLSFPCTFALARLTSKVLISHWTPVPPSLFSLIRSIFPEILAISIQRLWKDKKINLTITRLTKISNSANYSLLQSDKIGWNSMQFFSRGKSNPKRREHSVTNFSLLQKRLRILRRSYFIFGYELDLGTFLWLITIAFWGA